jgi:hypothetical protein
MPHTTGLKVFRNKSHAGCASPCTNIVACQGAIAPGPQWEESSAKILVGLTQLWIQNGVRYWGYL